ncbi:MAG: hypothetical protein ACRDKS_02360 [Actinomycetota bacterium]
MTERDETGVRCTECGHETDGCSFCQEPTCGQPICFECLREAVGQAMPQPHAHGG